MNDTAQPNAYFELVVTGHQYSSVVNHPGIDTEPMARVLFHRYAHQAGQEPVHTVLVERTRLQDPPFRLGAIWKLIHTGESVDTREYED